MAAKPWLCIPLALAGIGLLLPSRALSATRQKPEIEIAACIRRAAAGRGWLERTLWGLRDQEAGWIGAQVKNRDGTHDLGPLQVNSWWIPRIATLTRRPEQAVRYWLINDPCFNIEVARWIFLLELSARRDYWLAIGGYHSPLRFRQQRYSLSVEEHMRRRFGSKTTNRSPK